jgi:hypothetical protein
VRLIDTAATSCTGSENGPFPADVEIGGATDGDVVAVLATGESRSATLPPDSSYDAVRTPFRMKP